MPIRLIPIILLTSLLAGCGPATSAAREKAGKRGTIGVSLLTLENPFFKVIGDELTAEAAKHGFDTIVVSADKDPARQGNQMKDFIVAGVVAIVLSPCESRSIVPAVQEADAAGIPVFTVDIPCREPGANIACQIATDNLGGGREAGQAMIEALGQGGGEVALLNYPPAESCRLRAKGFREVIDKYNATAAKRIEIVTDLDSGGAKDQGYKAAEDSLQAYPALRGIFAINDPAALGARAALEKAGKARQVQIIGFDGQLEGLQAIKDGKVYADAIQFPDRMGVEVVRAIVKYSQGRELPPEMLIPTSLYRQADGLKDPRLK